jgi:protein-S-isoprenylcysteine O-methyltransferase Ste14
VSESKNHPAVRFPPPLVFLGFLLLGPVVDRLTAWALLSGGTIRLVFGGLILLSGLAVIFAAIGLFRRAGENPEPWTGTATLVTDGIYRFTRNPMYLGMAFAHLGLALLLGSIGALLSLPLAVLAIGHFVIPAEEAYLAATLGEVYRDYCARVRRWF